MEMFLSHSSGVGGEGEGYITGR